MFIFGNAYKLQQWCIHNGKKRVSSVLLKEFQAYLSAIYVTCNTCNGSNIFIKTILFEGREAFFFLSSTVAL